MEVGWGPLYVPYWPGLEPLTYTALGETYALCTNHPTMGDILSIAPPPLVHILLHQASHRGPIGHSQAGPIGDNRGPRHTPKK